MHSKSKIYLDRITLLTEHRKHHDSVMARLRAVHHLQHDMGIEQRNRLDEMKYEIITLTSDLADRSNRDLQAQTSALNDLSARLDDIQMRHIAALEQIQTLESLYFVEIRRRFDQIQGFIYGLDEYDGNENDVMEMLKVLSFSPSVNMCASSRPLRTYEQYLSSTGVQARGRVFDIAKFTRADMKTFVFERLHSCERFWALAYSSFQSETMHTDCGEVVAEIFEAADGVWLWLFFVTRQLIQQVERNESLAVLRKIIDFPAHLEEFFQGIIEQIDDLHKEEMVQIFLTAADELQPLPLYVLHLLEK